jgi:hypothetical protein
MAALVVVKKEWNGRHTYVRVRAMGGTPSWVKAVIYKRGQPVSQWFPLYRIPNSKLYHNNLPGRGRLKVRAAFHFKVEQERA